MQSHVWFFGLIMLVIGIFAEYAFDITGWVGL